MSAYYLACLSAASARSGQLPVFADHKINPKTRPIYRTIARDSPRTAADGIHMLKLSTGLALAAILSGCATALPDVPAGKHAPANPNAPVKATHYSGTLSGFQPHWPVEPLDWKELNRRVTPGVNR